MIWLTWRQFRTQAATVYAALAVIAVILAITGSQLLDLYQSRGEAFLRQLSATDSSLYYGSTVVMYVVPAIIGTFWGAPLITRELDAGTHRLVWNQSITRTRWLAVKLGLVGLGSMAAAGLLSLAVTWWADPIDRAAAVVDAEVFPSRLSPFLFDARGIAPVGYAAFAFVLGVTAGVLIRRTVPAMAVTLAVFTVVQIVMPLWVRPHLIAPVHQAVTITGTNIESFYSSGPGSPVELAVTSPPGAWVLSNRSVDATGRTVSGLPAWVGGCVPPPGQAGGLRSNTPATQACLAKLADLGYRQSVAYQPAGRFWALQWSETAIFLVLSLLLTGFCFRWTRRLS